MTRTEHSGVGSQTTFMCGHGADGWPLRRGRRKSSPQPTSLGRHLQRCCSGGWPPQSSRTTQQPRQHSGIVCIIDHTASRPQALLTGRQRDIHANFCRIVTAGVLHTWLRPGDGTLTSSRRALGTAVVDRTAVMDAVQTLMQGINEVAEAQAGD
jgi:hypothetical protein